MRNDLILTVGTALLLAAVVLPAFAEKGGPIVYAPDIVGVDRMFMVALK